MGIPTADRSRLNKLYCIVVKLQKRMTEHVKDKEGMVARIGSLENEVAAMSLKLVDKTVCERHCHHLLEHNEESKSQNSQLQSGEQNKGSCIQKYASSTVVKYTPYVEENEDAGEPTQP